MKRVAIPVITGAFLTSCGVNPEEARRALEAQGMSNVRITGYAFFGCSDNDDFKSKFEAIGANGKTVTGVVCSGLLKGVTVRFD